MRYLLLFFVLAFASCEPSGFLSDPPPMMIWVPVYAQPGAVSEVAAEAPRTTANPGKIYAYGSWLFQVDQYEGIHIIDNSVPSEARKVAFLKVPYCTEISIKDHHLYTNNHDDLVVFELAEMTAPRLVKRLEDVFPEISQDYPPLTNIYFECPDPSKGIIVRWEQKNVPGAKCRR